MKNQRTSTNAAAEGEDHSAISWAPWATPRRLIVFLIGWLTAFALLSGLLSSPFQSETHAGATPDYAKVMFLHGLLIGMVALFALLTLSVLKVRSMHARIWIAVGAVVATVLASVGGIFDTKVPGAEVGLWTQIFGFMALDEILLVLVWAIVREYRHLVAGVGRLPVVAAIVAATSMFLAAVMGHIAGWLMEFGENPGFLASFRGFSGFATVADWTGALVGSHSHEMAVSSIALVMTLMAVQFGYRTLSGARRVVARIGLGSICAGVVGTTALYLIGAFTTLQLPGFFTDGITFANGSIPPDDVFSGVLVMGGGVVVAGALLKSLLWNPARLAAAWAWVLSFSTVAVAGYYIEMNTANFFGAGDQKAAGAAHDAIFTWLHQDVGLFLLPTMLGVLLAVDLLVTNRAQSRLIGTLSLVGTSILFAGGMLWVFAFPDLHGIGFVVTTIGVLVVGAALLATIYYSVADHLWVPPTAGAIGHRAALHGRPAH